MLYQLKSSDISKSVVDSYVISFQIVEDPMQTDVEFSAFINIINSFFTLVQGIDHQQTLSTYFCPVPIS